MKIALICGISGQDGTYLTELLLGKGYEVVGTSRDADRSDFRNLDFRGLRERVQLVSMNLTDFRSVLQILEENSARRNLQSRRAKFGLSVVRATHRHLQQHHRCDPESARGDPLQRTRGKAVQRLLVGMLR